MITTLYNFSNLLKDEEELKRYFSPAENPFEGREEKGRVLVGEIENGEFKKFSLLNFNIDLIPKILYRRPSSRGTGIVPTIFVNLNGVEKTRNKLERSLNNNENIMSIINQDKLIDDFTSFEFNNNYAYVVTLKIDEKWLGEIEEFRKHFFSKSYKKYYHQSSKGKSIADNQICSLTGSKGTVYGFVNTLGFAIDSQSFIRNGFNTASGYKMFPVSEDAIPILEGARAILKNKLSNVFFEYKDNKTTKYVNYAILPHFVFQPVHHNASYIAQKFLDKAAFNIDSKSDKGSNGFINDTEFILNEIIKDGDLTRHDIYYSILFFEQSQAQFRIYLELNDVLPSRISKVLDAKEKAQNFYKPFTSYTTEDGERKTKRITLCRFKDYFNTGEKNTQPAFYKLINSIFTNQPYDDSKLLKLVLNTWKMSFKKNYHDKEKEYYFNSLVKQSLANLYFLHLLGIFKKDHTMNKETQRPDKLDAFHFIETHPAYFEKEYLKGAFIFGCLVARLLYNQRGNAFMKELHGLNIDQDLITKKFPKLISKLRQYDAEFPEMEAAALRYFAESNDKISKDEISFAFTMGLVLQKDFDRINKANKNQNSEENEQYN